MFADEIAAGLSDEAYVLVHQLGVGSYEELYGVTLQFPSIATAPGISLPSLSNVAAARLSTAARTAVQAKARTPIRFAKGSFNPPRSTVGNGYQQSPPSGPPAVVVGATTPIVHSLTTPIKNQGQRGTCVAHAIVACAEEHFLNPDLSEQFLYWAAKTNGGDPFPDESGTWLRCARNALDSDGVCEELLWPYNATVIPGNETHEFLGTAPSSTAIGDASVKRHNTTGYRDTSQIFSGKAITLLQELNHGPVAVALPTFMDRSTNYTNWEWTGAYDYGHVLDPVQFSVVDGGHAVCVCEYYSSTAAPGGGWFIFKNSWGTQQWSAGTGSVPPGHPPWKAGYGYLSAAYVDEYLWEFFRM